MTIKTGTDGDDTLLVWGPWGQTRMYGLGGNDVFMVGYLARSWRSAGWVMDFGQDRDKLNTGGYPVRYQKIDTTGDGAVDSTAVYHQASGRSTPPAAETRPSSWC